MSCWQLAVVCRFFAEIKDHPLGQGFYKQILSKINSLVGDGHPWQFCTYNLGRISINSGDEKNARSLLEKSLEICLSENSDPTIKVMALLPLSLLVDLYAQTWDKDKDSGQILYQAKQKILLASRQLNDAHFAFLQEISFEEALAKMKDSPGDVFPFSYR